jgi:hypothetical protein
MTSKFSKAVKAESIVVSLSRMPLDPEAKQAIEYAAEILSEVRHAASQLMEEMGNEGCAPLPSVKAAALERLYWNVLASERYTFSKVAA